MPGGAWQSFDRNASPVLAFFWGGAVAVSCTRTALAFGQRWGFDKKLKVCRRFMYGGCKGNSNRFGSKEECMKGCNTTKVDDSLTPCDPPVIIQPLNNEAKKIAEKVGDIKRGG